MGCFAVFKKKKPEKTNSYIRRVNPQEHSPTTLPEPPTSNRSLQSAPPSFKDRVNSHQPPKVVSSSRTRALSAPSSLHDQGAIFSSQYIDQEESNKNRIGSMKERRSPSPQPLPLPSPPRKSGPALRSMESFKSITSSGPLSGPAALPLPPSRTLRNFSYEEMMTACQNFSPERCVSEGLSSVMYRASFGEDNSGLKKLEATVTCLHSSTQGLRDFVNEVNTLASMQHPNLCKLIGFHASDQRMLVYDRLFHGSLDRLLFGRLGGPPLDWNARTKVALCAAQGLTFLHEEGPFQAMFNEFSTANIQIDKDFSAKLSGYGCINHISESEISNSPVALANLSVETLERGLLTPKSNVWCFGIVLLELLTGRKNLDSRHPKEERNLVKWSKPFLSDDSRLSLIMDPHLKGRYPIKAARTVADVAQRCLQIEPSERPTMRTVVENLKSIQDMKYSCLYPLKEPETVSRKNMLKSPSLNGIIYPPKRSNLSPSLSMARPMPPMPPSLTPWSCSPVLSLDDRERQESRRSSSSSVRSKVVVTVEGF